MSLKENGLWDLVELLKDQKAIGSKCVYKLKMACIEHNNTRPDLYVTQDVITQKIGTNYASFESYSFKDIKILCFVS